MWKAIFFLFSPPYILLFRSVKTRARMQSSGKHCLKWNNFQEKFKSAFGVLYSEMTKALQMSFAMCPSPSEFVEKSPGQKRIEISQMKTSLKSLDHFTGGLDIHNVRSQEAGLKLDIILRIREGLRVTNLWECTGEGAIQENYKTEISISFLLKTNKYRDFSKIKKT